MEIAQIAHNINKHSLDYKIGNLQNIRKQIKGLSRRPSKKIFHKRSISDNWAFHYGGRKEIQFNIGFDKGELRFGLAFSLQPSPTVRNLDVLRYKIDKLNCLIRAEPKKFEDYYMWHWYGGERSETKSVQEIEPNLIQKDVFIFFGKTTDRSHIDYHYILKTFDDLLEIYLKVESKDSWYKLSEKNTWCYVLS